MAEIYKIKKYVKNFEDINWSDLDLYQKTTIAYHILDISLLAKNFHRTIRENGVIEGKDKKFSKAQHDRDEISSLIIIKLTLKSFDENPWMTLNQIIHFCKSKGGKFVELSRDTYERRVSSLCISGEIEKTHINKLKEQDIAKISHIRNFKYAYKVSTEANEIHRKGEYNVAKAAPLDNFLQNIINIINTFPANIKSELVEKIKD
mgnify:FL=1